jgi:hypothetical protein
MFGLVGFFSIVEVQDLSCMLLSICGVKDDIAERVTDCQDVALIVVLLVQDDPFVFICVVEERTYYGLLSAHDITI